MCDIVSSSDDDEYEIDFLGKTLQKSRGMSDIYMSVVMLTYVANIILN